MKLHKVKEGERGGTERGEREREGEGSVVLIHFIKFRELIFVGNGKKNMKVITYGCMEN